MKVQNIKLKKTTKKNKKNINFRKITFAIKEETKE
jgi:hypothetical protein